MRTMVFCMCVVIYGQLFIFGSYGQTVECPSEAGLLQTIPVKYFHQTGPDVGSANPLTQLKSVGINPVDLRICADGSSATLLEIKTPNSLCELKNFSIRMKNDLLGNNPDEFGEFKPNNKNISDVTLKWRYSHPIWLSEPDIILNYRDEIIQILYNDSVIREVIVRLLPTPVMMVHGLWGRSDNFTQLSNYLFLNYYPYEYYSYELLDRLNYENLSSQSYRDIYRLIPDNIISMQRRLAGVGISSGKVDLVAHSMGGLLGRYYFQSSMYRDDVRKIITINTPHAGTPAANFLKSNLDGAATAKISLYCAMGGNVVDGAVDDLMVSAPNSLQTLYQSLGQQQVPSHAIETTDQPFFNDLHNLPSLDELLIYEIAFARMPLYQKLFVGIDKIQFFNYLHQSANDFLNSCFRESNDFIVPASSQDGGLMPDNLTQYTDISHTSALKSQVVQNQVLNLLKVSPKSIQYFSANGYNPPYLSFDMNQKSPTLNPFIQDTGCSTVILTPANTVFNTGDTVIVQINSPESVFYQRLWIKSEGELLVYHDTVGNSMVYPFIIPEDLNGSLRFSSMSVDTNNQYCLDSLVVTIHNTLTIDSITSTPYSFFIPMCGLQYLNVTGYANDTVKIPLIGDTSLYVNVLDTTIAAFQYPNFVRALHPGSTFLQIVRGNDTLMAPLNVYNNNLFLVGDSVVCTGTGGSELHLYSANEGRYYQLFRNDTAIGPPLLCGNDKISFGSFLQPGEYSVIEVDSSVMCVNSHSNKINLTISNSPLVNLGADTILIFPDSIILDAGNTGSTYLWSTNSTSQTITVNTAGAFWVEVSNGGWCPMTDTIIVTMTGPGHAIQGRVTYQNTGSTAMNNSIVKLFQGASEVGQQITDSLGYYSFTYPIVGDYHLETSSAKPWGGVNAIDALMILRHFVNLSLLEGLNLLAGDVDASGFINSIDALYCMKRFVSIFSSFPAGDWVFEHPEFHVNTASIVTQNIRGLCFGDENGSYVPDYCVPWPSQPYAGNDSLNIPGTTYNLSANIPYEGNGKWKKVSGPWGVFSDSLQAQTSFTGLQGQTYYLTWSIATICHTYTDTVIISFFAPGPCHGTNAFIYEGQTYNTVEIGTQCWMKENLNIGLILNSGTNQQNNGVIEKYCMNNNPANCEIYGGLYQWDEMMNYTVTQGTQGICPAGWHIPTESDWCILTTFLDPTINCEVFGLSGTDAGGKMKETGTSQWQSPNSGATNASGFSALPAGGWNTFGSFPGLFTCTYMWTSTEFNGFGTYRTLFFDQSQIAREYYYKSNGNSLRCLKND